jgi:hypothetical protein
MTEDYTAATCVGSLSVTVDGDGCLLSAQFVSDY